ncbi:hypothetical protein Tco_1346816 [Tanacetum coccineum]
MVKRYGGVKMTSSLEGDALIIIVNLPPPNNDLNVPKDEHAPALEHAPIAPNPAPIQPNDYLADDEEDTEEEPEEEEEPIPEQALSASAGFAPQWIGWHVEAKEEDKEEIEVEDNDDENNAEIIHPYEEADPLNRPPPSPETAEQEFMNAHGSSTTVFNPALCKVNPLGPMGNDPNTLYFRVKTLTKKMWDMYRVESSSFERLERNDMRMDSFDDDLTALDSTLREKIQEIKKLMAELNEQFQQIQERDLRAENKMLRIRLRAAEEKAEDKHIEAEYYKNHWARVSRLYGDLSRFCADVASDRGGESVDTTAVVKDIGEEKDDEGDDDASAKDSQPSESHGSPRDLIGTLERDNLRLEGMLCVDRKRVDHLRRSMSYTQKDWYYNDAEGEGDSLRLPTTESLLEELLDTRPRIRRNSVSFKIWEHCLDGIKHTMFTNHKSLQYILDQMELNMSDANPYNFKSEVSPWKGVICFGKREKFNLRYIGPFKILVKVGIVAYQLELLEQLSRVHSTFHVSNLKKYLADETLAIPLDEIQIDEKPYFIEEPVEIMDREVKRLKQSRIPIVKVRWNSRRGPEFTWEREDQMQKKYPQLFANPEPLSNATS